MNGESAKASCPNCGVRVDVNANFCPNCGFKLPKTRDLDTLKILEIKGNRGVVEVYDIRVMEGGIGISFTLRPQAPIEYCSVSLLKILPEPIERKFLWGIITLIKERELLGGAGLSDPSSEDPDVLLPFKSYRVCLYTKETSKKACEEDVVHTFTTVSGKVLEKGFKYTLSISGTIVFGEVENLVPINLPKDYHPYLPKVDNTYLMPVKNKVEKEFLVEYILEY
jgi:hypothetical protein